MISRSNGARRPFVLGYWVAGTLAVCGGGLLLGLTSPFVPQVAQPVVGGVLLLLGARRAYVTRTRLRTRPPRQSYR